MKLIASLLLLLVLSACARHPLRVNAQCIPSPEAAPVLLAVTYLNDQRREQMLLHPRNEAGVEQFIAFNPVGATLFEGSIRAGEIVAEATPFYRGVDPATLIWAYRLWQDRERAGQCWAAGSQQVQQTADLIRLNERNQSLAIWRKASPAEIELPRAAVRLTLRVTD